MVYGRAVRGWLVPVKERAARIDSTGEEILKAAIVSHSIEDGYLRAAQQDAVERVVLVDANDQAQGDGDKLDVHRLGQLHRAFSIFIFNAKGDVLLQQRAGDKYHFAGYWSNSCCGHPRPGEPTAKAALRRLGEELGFHAPLSEQMQLVYRAQDPESGLIEHEYLHVFRGRFVGDPRPDPREVGAWRWMSVPAVRRAVTRSPGRFTPWFKLLADRILAAPER